jgi:hypothetical protein
MEQSPSWKANSRSTGQEIPCVVWNLKVHFHETDTSQATDKPQAWDKGTKQSHSVAMYHAMEVWSKATSEQRRGKQLHVPADLNTIRCSHWMWECVGPRAGLYGVV